MTTDLQDRPAPVIAPTTVYAVAAAEAGTAIVTASRDDDNMIDVAAIDRLPAGLEPAAAWLREAIPDLRAPHSTRIVVDADGLGAALWDHLAPHGSAWTLYPKRGKERQELVNALLVAQQERRVRIQPSPHGAAVRAALLNYRRVVGDDGVIGAELVIALALAAIVRARRPARIY